jgi:adenylate cyclase
MDKTLELAFLHADACSFAAAMAQSETLSVARLEAGRRLFEHQCSHFGGRVIDEVGDSMLFAFPGPDQAYLAAQAATEQIRRTRSDTDVPQPFQHRIGITFGRVQAASGALYGHCINSAARIGSLVTKGNIGVDASAWSKVSRHVTSYRWNKRRLFAKPDEPFLDFVEVETDPAFRDSGNAAAFGRNEPLVAILHHRSKESNQQSLVETGLHEALNWEFSSYFSSHGWRAQTLTTLGLGLNAAHVPADYVVRCGSTVSRAGVRVFASLSSPHMKSGIQTFSRDADETGDGLLQILALVSLVGSAIAQSERDRATNMRAAGVHQLVAAGRAAIASFSAEGFAAGMKLLRKAETLDADYPLLLSSLARAHAIAWRYGWLTNEGDHLEAAQRLSLEAHARAPEDPRCEADLAFVKFWANEINEAVWHYERSIDALPYHAELAADAGMVLSYAGHGRKAARILERSVANIPNDVDYRLWSLGDVYHSLRDYKQSLNWLSRMRDKSQAQRLMAANKVRLGLDPSAHVANVLALQPDFSVRRWTSIQPFSDERERIDFEEALLQAGLPP